LSHPGLFSYFFISYFFISSKENLFMEMSHSGKEIRNPMRVEREMMMVNTGYPELAAYLVDVLVRNDRGIRAIGSPLNRQERGCNRVGEYLRAIGRETLEEDGEKALWGILRSSVALLPRRREEALLRLIKLWAPLNGWLDDQDIPAPSMPAKHRTPVVDERNVG
jgi:hypothetical protein